ncbi:nucleoid-associated protein [Yersinia frederiksenii]|uniref:nucleoid-associated protein n=1 Tax=Enterobacter ludwigii TaxID=299767 RepID=UPI0005E70375|nr:37-kD nucleoid-associated bacterial protein [Yersinia frederiksenii]
MSFLTEEEVKNLTIKRMIFHVIGKKSTEPPILLSEISPPLHVDFFLERIKSAMNGNLFEFSDLSNVERVLRIIKDSADYEKECFTEQSKLLASDFQSRHTGNTSVGVFFLFELVTINNEKLYALIKYDNEDVVRYVLDENGDESQVPKLERFHESFVRKAEAMQKIALVRLTGKKGGQVVVRDRSKRTNISVYFEGFLQVCRVNSDQDLCDKLVTVLKEVFKQHRTLLPEIIQRSGVNKIYEVLHHGKQEFNPDDPSPLLTSIFGPIDEDSPVLKSFNKKIRDVGIHGESFEINPEKIQKPRRRRLETAENVIIMYDDANVPNIRKLEDGLTEITVVTAGITVDDIDTSKNQRSN